MLKQRIWEIVEAAKPDDRASRWFDSLMLLLIFLNVFAVILETVASVKAVYGDWFLYFEAGSIAIFTLEYLARMWSCTVDERYKKPVRGRLSFGMRPLLLIDLIVILPFYLSLLGIDTRALRALRLLRVFSIIKMGRYTESFRLILHVLKNQREELALTSILMFLILVISSCFVYFFEHEVQPDKFPDIPSTMWWGVVTLTTIGYGDVYPITVGGRILTGVIAIIGIGLFALPAGILGSGFVEAVQSKKQQQQHYCPHCGESLDASSVSGDEKRDE